MERPATLARMHRVDKDGVLKSSHYGSHPALAAHVTVRSAISWTSRHR
ncbi:hypothetical protein FHY17_003644 [Xanthomonas arboricola]|uniref:Uncharacterized protein n=1 Tax=Xanthomonas arboricola TaxID=56448 RepID=A0AB73GZH3_9XANT|nr:hypothetical protein [Xanthomonas arboricola]MBB5671192.1 hypothetical protein [Xanthomonas arboricola]